MKSAHTYATLEVSSAAYLEISDLLKAAGYNHAFTEDGTIDMHGIGLRRPNPIEIRGSNFTFTESELDSGLRKEHVIRRGRRRTDRTDSTNEVHP
jgi:hypothetical protein